MISVATVPTVYGIETENHRKTMVANNCVLQQYLPFTVLKLNICSGSAPKLFVATVPTVYGIETL